MSDSSNYKLLSPDSASGSQDLLAGKNQEDGLRRIQALLADWLRMESVVVLTAAGCSVGAGGRLMTGPAQNNLECLVLDAVEQCQLSADAKKIIEWKKTNDFGQGNFEDWLSYLFNASSLASSENSPIDTVTWKRHVENASTEEQVSGPLTLSKEDEQKLRKYLQKAIYAECALQLDRKELSEDSFDASSGHIPFLAKLIARDTNLGRTHLLTLNYDTLFEQAFEELGIQYFDGFSGKASARFDPTVYGLDIYYPGDVTEGRVRRFDKFLQYYKLHGSLHWYVDGNGIYRAQHRDLSFANEYRESDPVTKATKLQSDEYKHIGSFGILPTSQKFMQTLDMPYAHLFRLFHARLNQPQTFLLVLGYGFGDDHVNRIIETALMNPSLVMLVVEPDPNSQIVERISRYQNLGQRAFVLTERIKDSSNCTYQTATFADFAQNVMPDVQWLEDFKQLRRFEEQIRKAEDISPSEPTGGT
ncbi:MAG: SIR2 family protein [Aestuariivita sp.]|nr:SIR2 family protein [Aestuariivita sp.]